MTWDVALILGIDGLANGAVYLLAGLGLVLIFSVTRVVFVPFGDVAAFAALSLAAFETGRAAGDDRPGGDARRARRWSPRSRSLVRRGETARIPRAVLGWGVLPALPCLRWRGRIARPRRCRRRCRSRSPSLLVVPITPLVARVALAADRRCVGAGAADRRRWRCTSCCRAWACCSSGPRARAPRRWPAARSRSPAASRSAARCC